MCLISLKSFLNQTTSLVPSISAQHSTYVEDNVTITWFFPFQDIGEFRILRI